MLLKVTAEDGEGEGMGVEGLDLDDVREAGDGENGEEEEEPQMLYVLEESTGYMAPTLLCLSIMHTIIAFLTIIGYYCPSYGHLFAKPMTGHGAMTSRMTSQLFFFGRIALAIPVYELAMSVCQHFG